jgi:hypothetical protein
MIRLPDYFLVADATLLASAALAVPVRERLRGTAVSGDMPTVHAHDAADVPVALAGSARYVKVVKSSPDQVDPSSYIGTATKSARNRLVALEAVVFPPVMRGAGGATMPGTASLTRHSRAARRRPAQRPTARSTPRSRWSAADRPLAIILAIDFWHRTTWPSILNDDRGAVDRR